MLACVMSCTLAGLAGVKVRVEVDVHPALPQTTIVGLPDAAVRESKDRLMAALRNVGLHYPAGRITVNLAPAHVRKEGPAYDLPIALGMLKASGQLGADLDDALVIGEIALDGELRHTRGILPIARAARDLGLRRIVLPAADAAEAALVPGVEVVAATDIRSLVHHLDGGSPLPTPAAVPTGLAARPPGGPDLADVRGQQQARRALEVAAAGGHNVLMTGPPGAGKTLLARCVPSILPPLGPEEALEATAIHSVAGMLPAGEPLLRSRPFRCPHHTISPAGLIGGGAWPRPGEVSLAHRGVLFLDELPEFHARALEALRQPLEDRVVTIARAAGSAAYPASFTLIAARNPCPCGFRGSDDHDCTCDRGALERYRRRLSGPLLDRIDIHVDVPRVLAGALLDSSPAETSSDVRARVVEARSRQDSRRAAGRGRDEVTPRGGVATWRLAPTCNAELGPAEVRATCRLTPSAAALLAIACERAAISARGHDRVLKVARTIADLEGRPAIDVADVAEALQYRPRLGA